ncbi:MAG: methionyl-tRNA formyltransferase [Steroidobacterales bacterium]
MKLAFAGTPQFAVPALDVLHLSRHQLCAVFTQADRGAGRGRELHASPVKQRALELGLTVHQPSTFKSPQAQALLAGLGIDVFVVVAYGLILPPEALSIPPLGCLNIHASLLPRWRGAAPIQRAILAGDTVTGVTIMRMEAGLDTGPVLCERAIGISPQDTAQSLSERLSALGAELICATLERVAAGAVEAVPQAPTGVSYASKIDKSEALIDWHGDAAAIARRVRAFNPWPIAETRYLDKQLRIWEADACAGPLAPVVAGAAPGTVLGVSRAGIDVACGQGALRITRLQLPGRKVLAAAQFANSSPLAGARFGSP